MPDPDLEIRGGGGEGTRSSRRLKKGSPKNFLGLKIRGAVVGGVEGVPSPPLDLPLVAHHQYRI